MPHQCTNCGRVFDDGSKEMLSGCPDCGGNKFQFKPASATKQSVGESAAKEDSSRTGPDAGVAADADADANASVDSDAEASATADSRTADSRSKSRAPASREWAENRNQASAEASESTASASPPPDATSSSSTDTSPPATRPEKPDAADAASRDESASSSEDRAQASARSDVVTPEELSAASASKPNDRTPPSDPDGTVIEPESDDRPDLSELREELNEQFESIKIVAPGQYELNLMELYDRKEYIISLREDGRYVIEVPDTTWRRDDDE